jgi:ABC-2 type transport system permease protein
MTGLFVIIFGYSLGGQIESVSGFRYILYILPGLAGMGTITNSYSNTSTSLYMARIDRSIENILVAPLSNLKIVTAFVIGGVTRGLWWGGDGRRGGASHGASDRTSILRSCDFNTHFNRLFLLGVVSALWAEDWDHLATFSNFVITPFVYLGGVFYSVSMLPAFGTRSRF